MSWLILLYAIELGFAPVYQSTNVIPGIEQVYYIDMDVEIIVQNFFFVGGDWKTYFQPCEAGHSFYPVEARYTFNTGLRYKNIEIGFEHQCIHPVVSGGADLLRERYGGHEEIYIRISNKY